VGEVRERWSEAYGVWKSRRQERMCWRRKENQFGSSRLIGLYGRHTSGWMRRRMGVCHGSVRKGNVRAGIDHRIFLPLRDRASRVYECEWDKAYDNSGSYTCLKCLSHPCIGTLFRTQAYDVHHGVNTQAITLIFTSPRSQLTTPPLYPPNSHPLHGVPAFLQRSSQMLPAKPPYLQHDSELS